MKNQPIRSVLSLGTIFSFRMFGLFMILPVFALYANQLKGTTPELIGMALGIYGLTQALLQMPLGFLSDRVGRKPIIAIGLLIFAFGSVIAALSTSIHGVIVGRALQGAGAVGSTILALVGDLTTPEQRTKAMASIGMMIAFSFIFAIALGPLLNNWIHVPGIFWLTALLALLGIVVLYTAVPTPESITKALEPSISAFHKVLNDKDLLRLNFGIGALHAILTANFVVIPIALRKIVNLAPEHEWWMYLILLLLSFALMLPAIIVGEKRHKMKPVLLAAVMTLGISQIILLVSYQYLWGMLTGLLVLFTGFNLLEASLPSLVSKSVSATSRGTAMGIYSSCQFFGIFVGGAVGGWIYGEFGMASVFGFTAAISVIWWFIAKGNTNFLNSDKAKPSVENK